MIKKLKKTFNIVFNSVLLAFGLYFFLLQHKIAPGGVTGISLIMANWLDFFTIGQWSLFFNIILFIMAFFLMDKDFGKKTVLSALIISLAIMFFEKKFPNTILTNDIIVNIFFGAGIVSYALSCIFFNEASSGGTDIYAILSVIIQSFGLNYFIQGLGRKIAITVISDYSDEINEMILGKYKRGVSLYKAEGGYSHKQRNIILTVVPFRKYISIRDDILKIDKNAFVFTHTISEVLGEGFTYEVFE